MNSLERIIRALELEEPDRVPLGELYFDPPMIEYVTGKKALVGYETKDRDPEDLAVHNLSVSIECHKKLGMDMFYLWPDMYVPGTGGKFLSNNTVEDDWGVISRYPENYPAFQPIYIKGWIESMEDLDILEVPDPHSRDFFAEKAVEMIRDAMGDVFIALGTQTGFALAFKMMGLRNMALSFHLNPKLLNRLFKTLKEYFLEMGKAYMEAGCDGVLLSSDYADSKSLFVNPDLWRNHYFPYFKETVGEYKKHGAYLLKHSDGNNWPIMEDYLSAGIQAFHPWEPGAMDIGEGKVKYGDRLCLMGNIDCGDTLTYKSTMDVRKEVRDAIDRAGRGGGYILQSSNTIHSLCKAENVIAMYEEAKEYGKYPLSGTA